MSIVANGVLEQKDGWTTRCFLCIEVPWNPAQPPSPPYTWQYLQEHLTNPKSMDEYQSRFDTGPTIVKEKDGDPGQFVVIYPEATDPNNAILDGRTTMLAGTTSGFEGEISFFARSAFRVKDHAGMELSISFELAPENDGGLQ